jgi:hypothetical protein
MPKAQVTLTPEESKRLIAKAVARLPEVRFALRRGTVVICLGTTNAHVVEEITGKLVDRRRFAAGVVLPRGTCVTPREVRLREVVLVRGKQVEAGLDDVLPRLGPQDVVIKGANALDPSWTAGVFLASETGGTVGRMMGTVMARGVRLVIPVGLEKLVPGPIKEVAAEAGIHVFQHATGVPVGLIPLSGRVVTEIEAVEILTGARAMAMGAGGVSGAEGSVTLLVSGSAGQISKLMRLVGEIKERFGPVRIDVNCEECGVEICKKKKGGAPERPKSLKR